jgi:competence protein ComEA
MQEEALLRLKEFIKTHFVVLCITCLGVLCIVFGVILLLPKGEKEAITIEEGSKTVSEPNPSVMTITVDVSGAVARPGVYTLSSEARMKDALSAAGGITDEADNDQVSKNINLAQKLTDSSKIYIPFLGEQMPGQSSQSVAGAAASTLININTASLAELDRLPRIGEVTAQKIISGRPYQTINDLVTKKAVTSSVFSEIEKLVTTQ